MFSSRFSFSFVQCFYFAIFSFLFCFVLLKKYSRYFGSIIIFLQLFLSLLLFLHIVQFKIIFWFVHIFVLCCSTKFRKHYITIGWESLYRYRREWCKCQALFSYSWALHILWTICVVIDFFLFVCFAFAFILMCGIYLTRDT